MTRNSTTGRWTLVVLALLATAACDDDGISPDDGDLAAIDTTTATTTRAFAQIERLGNPLTSEVFVVKAEHPAFNMAGPLEDPARFTDDIVGFVTGVAGRSAAYGNVIASVLVGTPSAPGDQLKVFTTRAPGVTASTAANAGNVGWLTYVLDPTGGYGGRKLRGDDTVDKGLGVVFGSLAGNTTGVSPGLATDNVPANDKTPIGTFPYFPEPTR